MTAQVPLTFTQCKQIAALQDLRDTVTSMSDQPDWLQHMGGIEDFCTIQAVNHGGCASGAFMPAVTYYQAADTMAKYGDEITEYLTDILGEVPAIGDDSWSGYMCALCSTAVELWCLQFAGLDSVNWD